MWEGRGAYHVYRKALVPEWKPVEGWRNRVGAAVRVGRIAEEVLLVVHRLFKVVQP
jgi:hypothetical protein